MKTKHIIIGLIILVVVLFFIQKKEHAGSTPSQNLSNEAVQNIAKIYADTNNEAVFNNIKTTGKITGNLTGDVTGKVTGDVTGKVTGDVTGNLMSSDGAYKLSMQPDGNLVVYKRDGTVVWASYSTAMIDNAYKIKAGNNQVLLALPPGTLGSAAIMGSSMDLPGPNPAKEFYIRRI